MFASPLYFFILALVAAAGVSAQTADACTLSCVQAGLANSTCSSFTDLSCICKSQTFQETAANCLKANCTAADQQAALQLQKQECGTSSNTSSPASNSTSSSPASTSGSSKSSGATGTIENLSLLTAVITIAGVAVGGAFAL